tara:strand:- start:117309 stop:118649 length:1341 start_codon:yes stop_codon:yes gene_type:complete
MFSSLNMFVARGNWADASHMTDLTRRKLLASSASVMAGAALASTSNANAQGAIPQVTAGTSPRPAPAIIQGLPDVLVVGGGAFGAWSALSLLEKGAKVKLVDAYGVGNARQTSGDETRQIRAAYGEDEVYSRWAMRAYDLWHQRQDEFGRGMIYDNGVLSANEPEDKLAVEMDIFNRLGIPYEVIPHDELVRRWPQGRWDDVEYALYEPKAGTVKARESLIAVSENFQAKGGEVDMAHVMPGAMSGGTMASAVMSNGEDITAGSYLFACGPWIGDVFPDILAGYIRLRRSEVYYVGSPAGDTRYTYREFPNMWEPHAGAYAMSDIDYGYKVVPRFGIGIDPTDDDRVPSSFLMLKVYDYLRQRLPGLVDQPIVASRVCALEISNNHHYIIDQHPEASNVWIAGGGSGHAFKMGPMLGEYISDRMLSLADDPELRDLYAIATHAPHA